MNNKLNVLLALLLISPGAAYAEANFDGLSALITNTKHKIGHNAGTAIAVVQNGKVLYQGYFGYADIGKMQAVRSDTVFYIASTTKPFLALNTLLLEEAGKIQSENTMHTMFPDIPLNGVNGKEVTARHLLTHTSGLENNPLGWATAYSGIHTARTRRAMLALSKPNIEAPLGRFQYTNTGYNIVSVWLDAEIGKPWQQQLEQSIFKPLGMKHTTAYVSKAIKHGWTLAKPYSYNNADSNTPLYLRKQDNTMQAAGGLLSTAPDLARFLIAQLEQGRYNGKPVFSPKTIARSHQVQAEGDGKYLDFKRSGYAWGWYRGEYKSKTMLHHFGGFAGFHAHLSFMPEQNIGLVVLNNEDSISPRLTNLIADYVYSELLGETDFKVRIETRFEELQTQAMQLKPAMAKNRLQLQQRAWQLTLPMERYVGQYAHPLLGTITVTPAEQQALHVRWGNLAATATAYSAKDQIRVEFSPNAGDVIGFTVDAAGVQSLQFADTEFKKIQ